MLRVKSDKPGVGFLKRITPETKTFLVFAVVCLLIKLALVSWRAIYAIPNGLSDDGLMQNTAVSLLDAHWMGGFNANTLSKRNIFSFYLAFNNAFGIPLLIANEILYFVAILIIVFLMKKYTNKKWPLYIAFGLLFFNPATFATATSVRIYRDAVFPSVILICLGSLFHVFTNIKDQKPFKGWSTLYMASLTVFWFLREESIWILPIISICSLIAIMFAVKRKNKKYTKKTILGLILAPLLSILVVGFGFKILNFVVYGSFAVTEDQTSGYQNFYNAVGKINSDERTDTVDFSTDIRYKIYSVSPTFKTIEDEMENAVFPAIKIHGGDPEEINSGWTTWAVRWAMAEKGYYGNAKTANEFYEKVASEINVACDEGKIECTNQKPGLTKVIMSNIPRITEETFSNLQFAYTFSGTEVKQYYSEPEPPVLGEISENLTNENILFHSVGAQENPNDLLHYTLVDKIKIKILSGIKKAYQVLSPVLFWVAIGALAILSVKYLFATKDGKKFYQRPQFNLIVFSFSILAALLIRCLIVAYLNISAFYATSDLYLYACYSLVLAFDVMVLFLAISGIRVKIHREVKRDESKRK